MYWLVTAIITVLVSITASGSVPNTQGPRVSEIQDVNEPVPAATTTTALKETERFEQIYSLNLNGSVRAANISGNIKVTTWDSPQVRLVAVKTASDAERMKDLTLQIESTADAFSVKAKYRQQDGDDGYWDKRGHLSVEYELTVPRTAVIEKIASVSGNVAIDGSENETRASSVSGNVTGRNLGGKAKLSSVSGEVEADFSNVGAGSDIRLTTVSGSVDLKLPSYTGAKISASTVSGNISNDFGIEVDKGKYVGNSMNGTIGDGSVEVKLSSVSGRVRVSKND
jgi:hypothetical protein